MLSFYFLVVLTISLAVAYFRAVRSSSFYAMAASRQSPQPLYVLRGFDSSIHSLSFLSSQTLLSGSFSGAVTAWDLKSLRPSCENNDVHSKGILGICVISEDTFWSHGRDGKVALWSMAEGGMQNVRSVRLPTVGFCSCVDVTLDELSLLCGAWDSHGELAVLDSKSGGVVNIFKPQQASPCGMCMAVRNVTQPGQSARLLSAHEDGYVRTWDLRNCKTSLSSLQTHRDPIFCCTVDAGLHRGMAAGAQSSLVMFSLDEGGQLRAGNSAESPSSGVTHLAVRNDSKLVLASLSDGRVIAYSWKSLKPLAVMSHHLQTVHCVACGPAGHEQHVFAAGSKDSTVSLWSIYR